MPSSPLDALKDVIPPTEVSWWPLSYAAWGLIVATLLVLTLIILFIVKRQRHSRAKREATQLAKLAESSLSLHTLLKRLVKHYYGVEMASLPQKQWLHILNTVSNVTFTSEELQTIYSPNGAEALFDKFSQAITTFKTREKLTLEASHV